jgi:NAD+ kinase
VTREFNNVALVGLYDDPRVAEPMTAIAAHLTEAGVAVFAAADNAGALGVDAVATEALAEQIDLIIAVGGDGTMLHAASLVGDADVPLLGINRGRLGFLADVSPANMLESLDKVLAGDYTRETRMRLVAKLTTGDGRVLKAKALNDIVLQRRDTGRMLDFETRIGGRYVNSHMGDGLIVATPTGSTAYALSCGGPIIEPMLDAVVVVPICPHTLSDRPLVIPARQEIEVTFVERENTNAEVSVDGHSLGELTPDDQLLISQSQSGITLIHPPGYDYFGILRSKLHWGRDSRRQPEDGPAEC